MNPTWLRHEAIWDPVSPDVRYYSSVSGVKRKEKDASLIFFNHHGGTQVRSLKMALIALMLTGLFAAHANARDHAVNGMLIGMAGGGMIGYMVGDEMDRDRHGRDHYRRGYRSDEVCRETVVVTERHGHYREDVRTVCRDRDDWHRPHNRGYYRHTRYGHNDRW